MKLKTFFALSLVFHFSAQTMNNEPEEKNSGFFTQFIPGLPYGGYAKNTSEGVQKAGEALKIIAEEGIRLNDRTIETVENVAIAVKDTGGSLEQISENMVRVGLVVDKTFQKTNDTITHNVAQINQTIKETVAPPLKTIADKGVCIKMDPQSIFIADNMNKTIKTLCLSVLGTVIAGISVKLIYDEINKPKVVIETDEVTLESSHPTIVERVKWLITNRATLGVAGLVTGLILIIHSSDWAEAL